MGNKPNVPMARAYSTTTAPPTGTTTTTTLLGSHPPHRINRRRSELQHNSGATAIPSKRQQQQQNHQPIIPTADNNNVVSGGKNVQITTTLVPGANGTALATTDSERIRQANRRRWSSVAMVTPRGSQVIKPKRITPRQCHLIIKSWSKKTPKCRVAKDIFIAIFAEAEELKSAFGISPCMMGKRLRTDQNFVAHTNMFADTLDFVIRNLDDISLVTENAEQLGRRHASFPIENGFRPEYWNIFTECICESVSAGEEDKETQIAWRQLIQTIVYYMKLGFDRETLRITRHASFRRSNSPRIAQLQHEESGLLLEYNNQKQQQLLQVPQSDDIIKGDY